jgi:hypothetical protein
MQSLCQLRNSNGIKLSRNPPIWDVLSCGKDLPQGGKTLSSSAAASGMAASKLARLLQNYLQWVLASNQ